MSATDPSLTFLFWISVKKKFRSLSTKKSIPESRDVSDEDDKALSVSA